MSAIQKPAVAGFQNEWPNRIVREGWADPRDFLHNPKNHRIHPDRQRKAMVKVLGKTGWVDKIKVQDGSNLIIDGHMRCTEAIIAGEMVPVTWLDLTDEEAEEMLAFFDPIGAMAERDEDKYRELVTNAMDMDEELRATLLDMDEIERQQVKEARRARRGDEDATPDLPDEPVVVEGDIWKLGDHILVCGDCLDPELMKRATEALGEEYAMLIVTDPPYNAEYVSRVDKDRANPFGAILNDSMGEDEYGQFLYDTFVTCQMLLQAKGSIYVCIDDDHYAQMETLFKQFFTKQGMIVWDKEHFGMGSLYRNQHELILFGTAGQHPKRWNAGHNERNVWSVKRDPSGSYKHPTQKPVEIAERAIRNSSDEGEVIIDLFGGAGFTLIAAEKLERRCLTFELSPRWAEVILKRWEDYTGDMATRLGDEVAYSDLLAAAGRNE